MKGWVYVISNRAMPDLIKVGFSMKDPELRATELNHTGSPHPYVVDYEVLVDEPRDVEQNVHRHLRNHREGKEWFRRSAEEAIAAIKVVVGTCAQVENYKRADRVRAEAIHREEVEEAQRTHAAEELRREQESLLEEKRRGIMSRYEPALNEALPSISFWIYYAGAFIAVVIGLSLLFTKMKDVVLIITSAIGSFIIAPFLQGYFTDKAKESDRYKSILSKRDAEIVALKRVSERSLANSVVRHDSQSAAVITAQQADDAGAFRLIGLPQHVNDTHLTVFSENFKQGCVNQKGGIVIPAIYEKICEFSDGLAAVKINNKWGFINSNGAVVILLTFDEVFHFGGDLIAARKGESCFFVDRSGNKLPIMLDDNKKLFAVVHPQERGCFVLSNGKGAIIGYDGKIIINPIYDDMLSPLHENIIFKMGGKLGVMSYEEEILLDPIYDAIEEIYDKGLASISKDNKWGLIDMDARIVVAPIFENYPAPYAHGCFKEGLELVQLAGKYGFIDQTGRIVITPCYEAASQFSEGLAPVELAGKYGFIDKTGKMVIAPCFDHADPFHDGFAWVASFKPQLFWYIDTKGNIASEQSADPSVKKKPTITK